ncbi:MAG: M28 family peptidase [Myxococcaceae bacterium]|nr:M28 family peptidase [Myxococcaceae bacterium]MCA3016668.1 M28 family peptidase [Myxococcaceae bacterium]
MTVPAVVTALLILDVVLRNRAVPGAADNLSGCSACVELAARLGPRLPDDVELVIVISGAEEAGTGGAQRLAEQVVASGEWTHADTIVLGLDTLSNGALRVLEEGELWRLPIAPLLVEAVAEENAARPRLPPVTRFVVPTGCTDALPFLVRGFPASSLTCIDPGIGAPRHCHRPSDTWSNVDEVQLVASIEFAERLVLRLSRHGGGERRGA